MKVGFINWKVVSNGRVYLFRKPVKYLHCCCKTGSFLFCHSVVSACLPPRSLRNPLTCLVAMTSAEDVGRGKSCFGLACGSPQGEPGFLTLIFFSVDLIAVANVVVSLGF